MNPNTDQKTMDVYASNAQYIESPDQSQTMNGVVPLDTLPAAWWNWLWNTITKNNNGAYISIGDLRAEMAKVIEDAGMSPSSLTQNQLSQAITYLSRRIATASTPGAVTSSSDIKSVSVDPDSGQMLVNAMSDWQDERTIKQRADAFESQVTTDQTQFKQDISKQQSDYETKITKQQTDFESGIKQRADAFESQVTTEEEAHKNEVDGRLNTQDKNIADFGKEMVDASKRYNRVFRCARNPDCGEYQPLYPAGDSPQVGDLWTLAPETGDLVNEGTLLSVASGTIVLEGYRDTPSPYVEVAVGVNNYGGDYFVGPYLFVVTDVSGNTVSVRQSSTNMGHLPFYRATISNYSTVDFSIDVSVLVEGYGSSNNPLFGSGTSTPYVALLLPVDKISDSNTHRRIRVTAGDKRYGFDNDARLFGRIPETGGIVLIAGELDSDLYVVGGVTDAGTQINEVGIYRSDSGGDSRLEVRVKTPDGTITGPGANLPRATREQRGIVYFSDDAAAIGSEQTALSAKRIEQTYAHQKHDSTARTYGLGTSARYGHVKLANSFPGDPSADEEGVTASRYALKQYMETVILPRIGAKPTSGILHAADISWYPSVVLQNLNTPRSQFSVLYMPSANSVSISLRVNEMLELTYVDTPYQEGSAWSWTVRDNTAYPSRYILYRMSTDTGAHTIRLAAGQYLVYFHSV